MAKRMLIDATHREETRVVVLNGNRLDEFDFESSTKKQVKGNIYLAKVTRVEPSLQAAFVEYGGNRHGFLAFSEIHADYYRIPVADRREPGADPQPREMAALETAAEAADEGGVPLEDALPEPVAVVEIGQGAEDPVDAEAFSEPAWSEATSEAAGSGEATPEPAGLPWDEAAFVVPPATPYLAAGVQEEAGGPEPTTEFSSELAPPAEPEPELGKAGSAWADEPEPEPEEAPELPFDTEIAAAIEQPFAATAEWAAASAADEVILASDEEMASPDEARPSPEPGQALNGENGDAEIVETLGGDEFEEAEHLRSRAHRHYKIQEVIKRRQIMLVQVTKEERGNKGAALTTYLSLAGRYCVLMPNTARGGGVSRKITNLADRRRLKEILEELDIPDGMGVIVRTAGAERSKAEIKRDYEYLLRLWNEIRDLTLRSTAPALIYEEGDLIKRSIRDLYTRDIDEVLVEGEEGYRTAKAFMKMLMPSHAKRVQPYRDPQIGLLHRFQVESQIDAIHSPIVQLRSGGYVVIDQTEALVAIDVNSGRSTRERNIEETALRTNLEAADEIARQLRLRDLAGLIVIDFIDMEEHRNQGAVERRLKEALKNDRARIQVGRISPFGLLEMSRQRLRPSLVEASTQPCPHCGGTGIIRSTESTALYVLRSIEEEGMRRRSAEVCVYVPTTVALYILNNKRDSLAQLETRYGIRVLMARDDALIPPAFRLERLRALEPGELPTVAPAPLTQAPEIEADEAEDDADELVEAEQAEHESEEDRVRSRRRRRRRRRHEDERGRAPSSSNGEEAEEQAAERVAAAMPEAEAEAGDDDDDASRLRRRRGRRGGRRRIRREDGVETSAEIGRPAADTIEIVASDADTPQSDTSEPSEGQLPAATGEMEWPQDPVGETAAAPIVTEIEAASLPAFAGDAASGEQPRLAAEQAPPSPTIAAIADEPSLHPQADEAAPGVGASPGSQSQWAEPSRSSPTIAAVDDEPPPYPLSWEASSGNGAIPPAGSETVEPSQRPDTETGEPLPSSPPEIAAPADVAVLSGGPGGEPRGNGASPYPEAAAAVHPPELPPDRPNDNGEIASPPLEIEPPSNADFSAEAPRETAQVVQEVTKKPENPRRGWWQRLIQS